MIGYKKPLTHLVFALLLSVCVSASALEKVSLQLQWLDQFQFAGYYVAKEKGFYQEAGLSVDILPYRIHLSPLTEVLNGNSHYGIGRSSLLIDREKGEQIVLLKAIMQTTPLILLTQKDGDIKTIKDLKGMRIMRETDTSYNAVFGAMLSANDIDFFQDLVEQPHSFNVKDLLNDKTDVMVSYVSNEPYVLQKLGVEPLYFSPHDYGFEFYDDILFTTQTELAQHPDRVVKFINASLRGWQWAFAHIEEAAQLIYDNYNSQHKSLDALIYEGKTLKKIAFYKNRFLGDIQIKKLQDIYAVYRAMGLAKKELNYADFVYQDPKSTLQKLKDFTKRHIDNGNLILAMIALLSIILAVVLWNIMLKRKIAIAVAQKLGSERLIFRQNRIKEMAIMMSGIAHQWRQPLANIGATVINIDSAYRDNKLNKAVLDEKLDNIENSVDFMSKTIDDFSHYLNPSTEQTQFCINDCITVALKLLNAEFLKHTVNVNRDDINKVLYKGRENELLQVLVIILNNAKDALINQNREKNITITMTQTDVVKINIADNGCGIDKVHLNKIFEPNFSTHNNHLDNGLGLYIAKSIINDRFCGDIKVSNQGNTVFTLVLGRYECGGGGDG